MNYPLRRGILDHLLYASTHNLEYALTEVIGNAPKRVRDRQMNLLVSHDTERIITALGNEDVLGL